MVGFVNQEFGLLDSGVSIIIGSDEIQAVLQSDVVEGDTVYIEEAPTITRLSNPSPLPTVNNFGACFSPDDSYLSIASFNAPYICAYIRSGDTYTKVSNPVNVIPEGSCYDIAFSPDGNNMAVAFSNYPYFRIYNKNGSVFEEMPALFPTAISGCGGGSCVAYSSDGVYFAVGLKSSNIILMYKRLTDGTYTRLADLVTDSNNVSVNQTIDISFSPNGDYLAACSQVSTFITIFRRSGDTFTKLSTPSKASTTLVNSIAFSPTGSHLALGLSSEPFIMVYRRNGDGFDLVSPLFLKGNPPYVGINNIIYDKSGQYLIISNASGTPITFYKNKGDLLTDKYNADTYTGNVGRRIAITSDSKYIACGTYGEPYLEMAKVTLTKKVYSANNLVNASRLSDGIGVANSAGSIGDAINITRFAK